MNAQLDSILTLTKQVLDRTEQGEWLEAAELDVQRRQQLQTFCTGLDPVNTPPDIIQALRDILRLNDALIGSVEHRQRAILREADTVRVGKQAVAAYGR